MMHVLHIAAWYPNALVPHEAPFIDRHVRALDPHAHNSVWHIDVRAADRWQWLRKGPKADRTLVVCTPLRRWIVIEWVATALILWAWMTRDRSRPVDIINFHIAYPNCTRVRTLRWLMRRPMVITEHYSAYRVGYKTTTRGGDRIRKIFHAGVPVIVVSRSLQQDITRFVGDPAPVFHVVDNAVDTSVFGPLAEVRPEVGRFFTIAGWRVPKRPDLVLEALAVLRNEGYDARLRMAGDGPNMAIIHECIKRLDLGAHVDLLGQLDEQTVADEMRRAHALVHASDYETYSAVCAEALCCGTPVIASGVGGITEFVTDELGVLVAENTVEHWVSAWKQHWQHTLRMDRSRIAAIMGARAESITVGARYHAVLRASLSGTS